MTDHPTHLDASGAARMVDVGDKDSTRRRARARSFVYFARSTFDALRAGNNKKGDVLSTARLAGIMAAKRTGELIPLCHPLGLDHVDVRFAWIEQHSALVIEAETGCSGRTGVEMEAMTAATVAALTVYDMAKGIERGISFGDTHLVEKVGGKSGHWTNPDPPGPPLGDVDWT